MKKLFVWAMLATLLMAGSAMAQSLTGTMDARTLLVQPNATFSSTPGPLGALLTGPSTTNNDDSCDISVSPAATLLLPHFEVEWAQADRSRALNTVFSITNTVRFSQIAHITIWTDWSFPVIDFNVYLTGYDVAGISLYDIIANGRILPPPPHLGSGYRRISPVGPLSAPDGPATATGTAGILANPNHLAAAYSGGTVDCGSLPGNIPGSLLADVRSALTDGTYSGCPGLVGSRHTNAEGYVTVDVANVCSQSLPTNPDYFIGEILFDNVLIGDYQRINPRSDSGNYAGGNPMVHIKAIPEGGPFVLTYPGVPPAGVGVPISLGLPAGPARNPVFPAITVTNFDWTFYDRYTLGALARDIDRRQPLPGLFAARFIESAAGAGGFITEMAIWREGLLDGATTIACPRISGFDVLSVNGEIPIEEIVRFDEQENPSLSEGCQISPCPSATDLFSPETSSTPTSDTSAFPPDFAGTTDSGGWMYMNLNNGGSDAYSDLARTESQNWVTIRMTAEGGRYGVDFDAAFLGNGCSNNPGSSTATSNQVQPSPNLTPALPSIVAPCTFGTPVCIAP